MTKVQIPVEAKVDLSATVPGQFSHEDWQKILSRAEAELSANLAQNSNSHLAWQEVVRDFYAQSYWGFHPQSKAQLQKVESKRRPKKNMGVALIWMVFNSMCLTKVAVLWLGQIYSRSQDSLDLVWLLLAIFSILANFAYFLWRNRNYVD